MSLSPLQSILLLQIVPILDSISSAVAYQRFTNQSASQTPLTSAIINGGPSQNRAFFASLVISFPTDVGNKFHSCGGAIIDSNWVVTSGQCIPTGIDVRRLLVEYGDFATDAGGLVIGMVTKAIRQPAYTLRHSTVDSPTADVALLKLSTAVRTDRVIALCTERKSPCTLMAACGLGQTHSRKAKDPIVLNEALFIETRGFFSLRCPLDLVCARGVRGMDTRIGTGDIGSPLYTLASVGTAADCLYGVASYHEVFVASDRAHRSTDDTSYFTSLPYYSDWILEQMEVN